MAIRVVLAEDSYIAREGIEQMLEAATGIEVVAACGDLDSLLAAIEAERPHVVVTDIRMPPTNTDEGIRVAGQLRDTHPEIGVVVLSQHDDPCVRAGAARVGLRGTGLPAQGAGQRPRAAGRRGRGGGPRRVGDRLEDRRVPGRGQVPLGLVAARRADVREREVLAEIAQGKSNAAIADSLVLTKRAVEKHINAIFMKLGLAQADDVSKRVKAALMFLADAEAAHRPSDCRRWCARYGRSVHASPPDTGKPHCGGCDLVKASAGTGPSPGTTWRNGGGEATQDEPMSRAATAPPEPAACVRVLTVDDQAVFRRVANDVIAATPGSSRSARLSPARRR